MKEIMAQKTKNVSAIGPYNLCIKSNGFIFTSGMLGLDPETGALAEGVEAQTEMSLKNLKNLLEDAGTCMCRVVKATVFIKDMNDFSKINAIYSKYFDEKTAPVRACVEVARLPKDALVEIELVAEA